MLQENRIIIIMAMSIAGTNMVAYFSAASEAHKKSLTTLTPESNVIKLFYFVTDAERKKIIVVLLLILIIIIALSIVGTNTAAYFSAASVAHKKSFVTLTPESNVLKLFYFVTGAARK